MSLNVGYISYINCAPFFHYLPESGFAGNIVSGVPSRLNRLLAAGEIDLSPSSSFEYGRNWRDYLLLPGQSISSFGPVQSVLLFTPRPLAQMAGGEIALTGESATSVNLLQVLLREYLGLPEVSCRVPEGPVEAALDGGGAALLIGDRALREARARQGRVHIHDLGALWKEHTGLPFVFALWILRREAAETKAAEIRALQEQLQASRNRAFASLEAMAAQTPERSWMGIDGLVDYWQAMSYDLSDSHLEGLRLYFRLLVRHGLLPELPELRFFPQD